MTDVIERVARAIAPEVFNFPKIELYRSNYEKVYAQARAAIEAMREPTEAMVNASTYYLFENNTGGLRQTAEWNWKHMIDAALSTRQEAST